VSASADSWVIPAVRLGTADDSSQAHTSLAALDQRTPEGLTPESLRSAWIADDPETWAVVIAGAGPLEGDACRIVFDEGLRVLRCGPVPVSFPPTSPLEHAGRLAVSRARIGAELLVGFGPGILADISSRSI
jgi:hypothetical protein